MLIAGDMALNNKNGQSNSEERTAMPSREPTVRLFCNALLGEGELHPLGPGLAAVFSTKAPEKESPNEDSCGIIPYDATSGILVVADGAGGQPSGARASEVAVTLLRDAVRGAAKKNHPLRAAILDGIERANHKIMSLGVGAATTLAVAEIQGHKMRPYHIGDSQIMVVGQKGKVKLETKSHSPVGYALEAGLIDAQEAILHEERHLVSNLLGYPNMHIEMGSVMDLSPRDTLLIASDGLFDNLMPFEIVETCRKGQLLAISRSLQELCASRMSAPKEGLPSKPDDLTFIAYRRRVSS